MAATPERNDSPSGGSGDETLEQGRAAMGADLAVLGHALNTQDSALMKRYMAARRAGLAFGGDRDYYDVLGYDRKPEPADFVDKYNRNDVARTVVSAPATTAWRTRPEIVDDANEGVEDEAETAFERAVERLFDEWRLLHYLERWDIGLGLGRFGVLFLGLREQVADGEVDLSAPATESELAEIAPEPPAATDESEGGLAYLSVFTEASVEAIHPVRDPTNPRYGLPESYDLQFASGADGTGGRTETVHYTRVLHAAEDLLENEIYGTPRLLPIYNRLEDLEKVVGGSAEMFWRGARRELILNYQGEGNPMDASDKEDEFEEMIHGLRTVGTVTNTDVETLAGDYPDPGGNVDKLMELIAGETGIPKRILTGSERGELASTQDRATFYGRISERQEQFCEPMLLRPVIDRLLELGILPEPKGGTYSVEWPDLFELNELEQAELTATNAEALSKASGGDPFRLADEPEIRERVLSWGPERGDETSLDVTPEEREREDEGGPEDGLPEGDEPGDGDGDPFDEDDEAQGEFEDLFEDLDGLRAVADGAK